MASPFLSSGTGRPVQPDLFHNCHRKVYLPARSFSSPASALAHLPCCHTSAPTAGEMRWPQGCPAARSHLASGASTVCLALTGWLASCQGERWLTKVHLSGYSSLESSHVKSTFKDLKASRNHQSLLRFHHFHLQVLPAFCRFSSCCALLQLIQKNLSGVCCVMGDMRQNRISVAEISSQQNPTLPVGWGNSLAKKTQTNCN